MKLAPLLALAVLVAFVYLLRTRKAAVISVGSAGLVVLVALSMILLPEPSFKAAARGLTVWWEIVLPALLPFFIAAELLMGMGIVHFMGVFMEPLMRPLFNVPGAGSFAFAMGLASGYPLGASLSARLKEGGLATKTEAERLMCFCNTSDPLFMSGAVAVGMFKRVDIGPILLIGHYVSAITVGMLLRFWRRKSPQSPPLDGEERGFIVARAYRSMRNAQRKNPKPFGEILGAAVNKSVTALLMILGFIVLSSVVFEILRSYGVAGLLSSAISKVVPDRIIPQALHESLVSGLFEITIGCSLANQATSPLMARVALVGGLIAWSGLSVHAQVAAVIHGAKLSVWPYVASRGLQGILAGLFTYALMARDPIRWALPAFEPHTITGSLAWFDNLGSATGTCLGLIGLMAVIPLIFTAIHTIRNAAKGR